MEKLITARHAPDAVEAMLHGVGSPAGAAGRRDRLARGLAAAVEALLRRWDLLELEESTR